MKIKLYYQAAELGQAWSKYFPKTEGVEIINASILDTDCDTIVSPANSFGFMDGGLDLQLSETFGWDLQDKIQTVISERPMKELLVGEAIIISTGSNKIPWLISAPTMRVPMHIKDSVNAYLAMKAILASALRHNTEPEIRSVAIPGLGTGIGALSPEDCAVQMSLAHREIMLGEWERPDNFSEAQKKQLKLNPKRMIYD